MKNNGLSLPIIMGIAIAIILIVLIIYSKNSKIIVSDNDATTIDTTTDINVTSQDILESEITTTIDTIENIQSSNQTSQGYTIQENDGTVQNINIHNNDGEVNPDFNIVVNGSKVDITTNNNINQDGEVYNIEIN